MVVFAIVVERYVLKHLVNQEPIILFMATIGLAYFMEGFGDLMWGADIKKLDVGLPQGGSVWLETATAGWGTDGFYGFYIDRLDIVATVVAALLVISLTLFTQYTKYGRALRAVADDHQAALVGRHLAALHLGAGLVHRRDRGAGRGDHVGLANPACSSRCRLIALKALPVLMLGGFTSIPGAIVGGLIIGVGEKLFEFLIGAPIIGGATENWFAYVLALLFLVFRPQGLFGEKIIERV